MQAFDDTIVATATPPGRAGVAVIRVSGKKAALIANALTNKTLQPRHATFTTFIDCTHQILDEGIAIFFPAPYSFTGEDVLELQGHGGPFIVNDLLQEILSLGARIARPGEFSERAFLNNKMDLVKAEAIADLINASSKEASRAALRSLQGEFSKKISILLDRLTHLRMYIEAAIDFVEEEINFLQTEKIALLLQEIVDELAAIEKSAEQGSLLRDGISMVIVGVPNVGKSSLLNCLSEKDTAIVTNIPGTTRDLLHEKILIDGIPVNVIDTAGLRESDDMVEREGIKRAKGEMHKADLILWVVDATKKEEDLRKTFPNDVTVIKVKNKIDLKNESPHVKHVDDILQVAISAKNTLGIDLLKSEIKRSIGFNNVNEGIFLARERHLSALTKTKSFILKGLEQLQSKAHELLAEDLRLAQRSLSEITGEFTSDDLLGKIFGSFCIGK